MERCTDNQGIPATATAGLSFDVSATFAEYPAPQWSATLLLRGPRSIDLPAVADGLAHTITVGAATTALWAPGVYWYSFRVQSAAESREVANGQIEILPDFAALPAGYDGRTQAELALEAIKAVLAKRATQDQQRYTIDNRELWRTAPADLIKLRAFYTVEVRRERDAKSGRRTFGRAVQVRFK